MFPVEAFENTIGKFVAIAEAIGLPFHIIGGSISSAYGEPRLTQDIDIVVSPDVARIRTDEPSRLSQHLSEWLGNPASRHSSPS